MAPLEVTAGATSAATSMTPGKSPLGGPGKIVEVDETYIGNVRQSKRSKSMGKDKFKVVTLVERNGPSRSVHVDFLTVNAVRHVVVTNASRKSALMTDESNVYTRLGKEFDSHDVVNHGRKEYVRGDVTTNTVEGFYQHCGEQHLQRYLPNSISVIRIASSLAIRIWTAPSKCLRARLESASRIGELTKHKTNRQLAKYLSKKRRRNRKRSESV